MSPTSHDGRPRIDLFHGTILALTWNEAQQKIFAGKSRLRRVDPPKGKKQ
jgi:hypothetical protein